MANLSHIAQSLRSRLSISGVWQNRLTVILFLGALLCGLATYAALHEMPPLGNDPTTVILLLNLEFILLAGLIALLARRIVGLWSGRKRGLPGSHVHVRLIYIFSILAAVPAIIMTVFSAFFFHFGIQSWFSESVQTAVYESEAVAEAYLEEHIQVIRADTLAMANDIDREAEFLVINPDAFAKAMKTQALLRNFSEAILFDNRGNVVSGGQNMPEFSFNKIPPENIKNADDGHVVISMGGYEDGDRVQALVRLQSLTNTYLFVGRAVDPDVLSHVTGTRKASAQYAGLQAKSNDLQIITTMIFVVVGLLLLMAAIWFGLLFARQIVDPVIDLIKVADRVRAGDLTARVAEQDHLQEFQYLGGAFNKMTSRIEAQQSELLETNRQLDERRMFTERILEGVTSGVMKLDTDGHITLVNSATCRLLNIDEADIIGKKIVALMPEYKNLICDAQRKICEGEIHYNESDDEFTVKTLFMRAEVDDLGGAVVTFDDITALQSAQRKAAWADVARRIAHEIKNPLTPIQLSAERLQRKFGAMIDKDKDVFNECVEVIVSNVEDIGRMVSEFSDFARMPEPQKERLNLATHIKNGVNAYIGMHENISIHLDILDDLKHEVVYFDETQLRQVLNNLIQNAIDAIDMRIARDDIKKGRIDIKLEHSGDDVLTLYVRDNGIGLPKKEKKSRLTEPYVTHKDKGTGLGLAIVKKIMDDHGGQIFINPTLDKPIKTGAVMAVTFMRANENKKAA